MNRLPEHPLAALLMARRQRSPKTRYAWLPWLVSVLVVPPLMAYGGSWAWVLGVLLVAAGPALLAAEQASLLLSLRHKDCLQELLSCSTSPAEMVDGLVIHAVGQMARQTHWLLLGWAYALAWLGGTSTALLAPLGVVAQLFLAAGLSYLAQSGAAWSRGEDDVLPRHLLLWLVLVPVLAGASCSLMEGQNSLAALTLVVPGFFLRGLAILGLTRYADCQRWLTSRWEKLRGPGGTAPTLLTFSDNPIVYREARAEAGKLPGGLLGLLLWRHGLTALLVGGFVVASAADPRPVTQWSFLVILMLVQTLRPAFRTVGALVDEQEGNTIDGLVLADMAPRQWVDGWATVGWFPRTLENAVIGIGLVVTAAPQSLSLWRQLVAVALLVTLPAAASYAGLLTSTRSTSRHQAYDRLGLELSKLWVVGVFGLLAALVGPGVLSWLAVALPAMLLVHLRRLTLGAITQPLGGVALAAVEETVLVQSLRQVAPSGSKSRLLDRLEMEGLVS